MIYAKEKRLEKFLVVLSAVFIAAVYFVVKAVKWLYEFLGTIFSSDFRFVLILMFVAIIISSTARFYIRIGRVEE